MNAISRVAAYVPDETGTTMKTLNPQQAADVMASVTSLEVVEDTPDFVVSRFWRGGLQHLIIVGTITGTALLLQLP